MEYISDACAILNLINQKEKFYAGIRQIKNKKYRYQMTEYSVEIERLVIRLENLFIEEASLEPTLLERIRRSVERFPDMAEKDKNEVYTWWTDLNNDFVRLNQNYQDYIRDISVMKGEPVYLTKNGRGRFVVMDIEDYERDRAEKKLLMKLQEAEEAVKDGEGWLDPEGNVDCT